MWRYLSRSAGDKTVHRAWIQISPSRLIKSYRSTNLHSPVVRNSAPYRSFASSPRRGKHAFLKHLAPLTMIDAQRRTIYALSTPSGKAGVAVIRVSGPETLEVWRRLVKQNKSTREKRVLPKTWHMERCKIVHPESGEILDDGLSVFFRGPKSFTTEDVLELHIHSGRAIVSSVLSALSRLPYCRPAEAGEFTRRAFQNGRLDLTQVEGLKDLIDAETDGQRRLALQSAEGRSRVTFEKLRNDIIQCLAMVEALIDFGEGEDIEEGVFTQAHTRVFELSQQIKEYLADSRRGEIMRSGIRLAIFGPPNAGKSSLLNFLAQREAAIVTPMPGTTRDILELSLDIAGIPVLIADTAGLRTTDDQIEVIGIERAKKAIQLADVSLCVLSLPDVLEQPQDGHMIRIPELLKPLVTPDTFFLLNKSDLASPSVGPHAKLFGREYKDNQVWVASLETNEGMQAFLGGLAKALQERHGLVSDFADFEASNPPLITHERHRVHLESALKFLEAFLETEPNDAVLGAEELRYAMHDIGKITGAIGTEDILDAVFREFCIGK